MTIEIYDQQIPLAQKAIRQFKEVMVEAPK